ncbi:toprim domain-containing protein [Mycoplasma miroungirhinis]|uniref:Recombination protein RecR n=1 Tax=Mycoplasma miroungirhinis TaxID=754516 RepID=A0A6M4JI03_9MOLU|nr:toprim domain-containing protein [Mycoplasma miroungirhinis]QJR44071.1 recombination protein RecR [Mycoplasma miroungirhinis]
MNDELHNQLLKLLKDIPGITTKQAEKIIYFILFSDQTYVNNLTNVLQIFKQMHKKCKICNNFDKSEICHICEKRNNANKLLVVLKAEDIQKFEDLDFFNGKYFVIERLINPVKKIFIDQKNIELFLLSIENVNEIILALPSNLEGQMTMQYLKSLVNDKTKKIYQLSTGIPVGASVDFMDPITLVQSLKNKIEI